jgi:SRSO17 transposase
VYEPHTEFTIPARAGAIGRPASVARADRAPSSVAELAARLAADAFETLAFAETVDGRPRTSRFACLRVFAASEIRRRHRAPRSEWLVIEWPPEAEAPTDYWLSNLPAGTPHTELARLARLRWTIELDYRQLKGELGLDHYEGRSWAGWHHHCALVSCAHAFLTEERLDPKAPRPA